MALRKNWDGWLENSKRIGSKRRTIRLNKENLGQYRQHLDNAINLAEIYANPAEDRKESAVYLVDTSIFQVFPKE